MSALCLQFIPLTVRDFGPHTLFRFSVIFHSVILHPREIELIINYDSRSTHIAFVDLRIIHGSIFCRPGSVDVDMHLRFLGSVPDPLQLLKAALQTGYLNGIPVQKTLVRHYNGSGK